MFVVVTPPPTTTTVAPSPDGQYIQPLFLILYALLFLTFYGTIEICFLL